jgi:P-type Cu+ transporter
VTAVAGDNNLRILLNTETVVKSFSASPNTLRFTFSVSRIKCGACAWKIESLLQSLPQYSSWFIDIPQSTLTVSVDQWTDVSNLVSKLAGLGFDATLIRQAEDTENARKKEFQWELLRLVIAAFCAGNIMSLSLSNYFGASDHFRYSFDIISLFLTLPALLFSAYPFYRGFWATLKTGVPSLDFPIALALFGGTFLSALNLFSGTGEVYFDSISGLILFLLASRFFLNRLMEKLLRHGNFSIPGIAFVREIIEGKELIIPAEEISAGKKLRLLPGDTVPCDGVLLSDSALLNTAVITGEPYAHTLQKADSLFAGAVVIGTPLEMLAKTTVNDSRVGQMLSRIAKNDFRMLPYAHIVNTWAMWFSYLVLAAGAGVFIYWWPVNPRIGIERVLALFMTSCPCALTFGFPLIMSICIKKAQSMNMIVQDISALSKLSSITDIYFDKTGTLTSDELKLITDLNAHFSANDLLAIVAIESYSHHPIAHALQKAIDTKTQPLPPVSDYSYTPTQGISANVPWGHYELLSMKATSGHLSIEVRKDKTLLGEIVFAESLRPNAKTSIQQLIARGLRVHILSGDGPSSVEGIARKLHINGWAHSSITPEEKQALIEKTPKSLFVGDGINDAAAISQAFVGIAMPGPIEKLNKVASIIFSQPNIENLPRLFALGKFTQIATWRLALLSFSYNVIISTLAVLGYIHPLIAAIIMPASSVVVILLVMFTRKEMEWKLSSY